jgi:acyl-coenzyme A synthetase/AMP-(fatty) acid ligase
VVAGVLASGTRRARGAASARWIGRAARALAGEATRGFLRCRLAPYKVPRVIDFSTALAREDRGKIFQPKLREPLLAGESGRGSSGHSVD